MQSSNSDEDGRGTHISNEICSMEPVLIKDNTVVVVARIFCLVTQGGRGIVSAHTRVREGGGVRWALRIFLCTGAYWALNPICAPPNPYIAAHTPSSLDCKTSLEFQSDIETSKQASKSEISTVGEGGSFLHLPPITTIMETFPQSDNASSNAPPIPTPDENGDYTCDLCLMKVRVGCGGRKNFMQHRGSPACLKVSKKAESKSQARQTGSEVKTLHLYFMKTTWGANQVQNVKQNGVTFKGASANASTASSTHVAQSTPSSLMTSGPDEPRDQQSLSANTATALSARPDAHALTLLNGITCAARELPSLVPEAEEDDDIARVVLAGAEDTSEAWEHLDCVLNRLLGYGVDIEDIAQCVRRGPLGVEGLV